MKYLVVIEKTRTGYSAYSPDLPGCAAAGRTRARVEKLMKDPDSALDAQPLDVANLSVGRG